MQKMTLVSVCAVLVCTVLLSGCATSYPTGSIMTKLKLPVAVTSNSAMKSPKVGTAECVSYLGMWTEGDISISAAMKNGGITKIHHVDWEVNNLLGLIGKYKLIVYGE